MAGNVLSCAVAQITRTNRCRNEGWRIKGGGEDQRRDGMRIGRQAYLWRIGCIPDTVHIVAVLPLPGCLKVSRRMKGTQAANEERQCMHLRATQEAILVPKTKQILRASHDEEIRSIMNMAL